MPPGTLAFFYLLFLFLLSRKVLNRDAIPRITRQHPQVIKYADPSVGFARLDIGLWTCILTFWTNIDTFNRVPVTCYCTHKKK